jgi:hypothetical protein
MIPDRNKKYHAITHTISTRIREINERYRSGPSLYFYRRITAVRNQHSSIQSFLSDDYDLEILYATLVSWDMNSRGAKMKYFDDFKETLISNMRQLNELEKCATAFNPNDTFSTLRCLEKTFPKLNLMETGGRLVSNSKCLHFLFPSLCMPMDRTNTLTYLYGNTNESVNKYVEICQFVFEIMQPPNNYHQFLDNQWNTTIPKVINNAIILLMEKSVKMSTQQVDQGDG